MYSLLKDRFELSILNNWVDSENNIYLLYTNKQLCSILNYAEPKIIKLKKELEKHNLIINERQGLNKPNRIYLLKPTYDKKLINSKFQNKENISSRTNKSSTKNNKIKKELEKQKFNINERQGLNKPNRIYLLEPTYDKELINSKFQNKENISSRTNKSSVQELTNSKSNDTEFNNTDYI